MSKKFLTPTKVLLLSAAGGYLGYRQYMKLTQRDIYDYYFDSTRNVSRVTGYLANQTIPVSLRKFIFTNFSKAYGVKLDELTEPDLTKYNTFLEFFTRTIKPRPVDADPLSVVSPADCKVLMCSEVQEDSVLIVKGVTYSMGELLTGIPNYPLSYNTLQNIKRNKDNKLYQCILYLAPGDYHRFHSPAKMLIKQRNYIYGTLLPVKLDYALTGKMKYDKNERVTVLGDWNEGFMSMVFVGALNVGSIGLTFDPELKTNLEPSSPYSPVVVKSFTGVTPENKDIQNLRGVPSGLVMEKGGEVGRFNLGSSIVLFFEANKDFKFNITDGEDLRYGQVIGK